MDSSRLASAFLDPRRVSGSIRTIRPLLGYLAARGYDTAAMLQAEGVEPSLVDEPEARLRHAVMIRVWEAAGRLTGDQDLGLHAAEAIRPGDFGAIEYLARTSQTLGAGLARLARYYAVLNDGAEVVVEAQRDRAVWSHRLSYPGGLPRQVPEYVIGCLLVVLRHATGVDWTPLEVRFPHQEHIDTSAHRRLFRAPLRFESERSELVTARRLFDAPLLGADPALQSLVRHRSRACSGTCPAEATTDSVRRLLAQELCDGEPTLERLAARLHMSARTLHRRLENEGTTFRRIVTDVRRELAERHLRERQLGVGEIAFLLGFSEASAFHRAFKRWTGQPPRAHRQAIRWQPVSSPPVGGEGIRAGHASLREERMASRGKAAREGWAPVDENSSLLDDALLAASCRVYGIMLFTNDAYLDRLLPHWRWRHVTLWAAHERCLVRRCDHKRENERRPEPD